MVKHSIFGVLAVAALDFTIGTSRTLIAGVGLLALSTYSFLKAAKLRRSPLEQTGTQTMTDDERDAWQLHHHGADWDEIGTEMGCSPTAAQTLAAAYEKRTDAAAHTAQNTLF
ncbi:hypothetical protein GA0061093_12716 [Rhodococcus qingshengii]|nr:hypothetical protein GA0061093_12716 [Rhodococcus qingshengii]